MRKLIVISMLSIDGVMQAPGGPEEDTSGSFKYGGWTHAYGDEVSLNVLHEQLDHSYDLLLGRKTYDIFASYWPHHNDNFIGNRFNKATKYVVTHSQLTPSWDKTVVLNDDVVQAIKKLKEGNGPEIQVHGSCNFIQTLFEHDLVDELWLKIFPVTLGPGKRMFGAGTIPAAFKLTRSKISAKGVIFADYERAGEIKTGQL